MVRNTVIPVLLSYSYSNHVKSVNWLIFCQVPAESFNYLFPGVQSSGGKRKRSTTPEWEGPGATTSQQRTATAAPAVGGSCGEAARLYSDITADDLAGSGIKLH